MLTALLLPGDSQAAISGSFVPPGDAVWTNWGASQFALADDGQSVWIGATGSVLQWDKTTSDTTRYGPAHGISHKRVLAAAIDAEGNRWFGGDGGLSRLDPDGVWTHYNAQNSALPADYVDGMAIDATGTLWLSHGLPDSPITRWEPGGGINVYSDREAAITEAYDQITQTTNSNDLWAVAGDEVWAGYMVFDGTTWHDRRPPQAGESLITIQADGTGGIWALADREVYAWDGSSWSTYRIDFSFDGYLSALAIGSDDSVWVGGQERMGNPYNNRTVFISRLPDTPGEVDIQQRLYLAGPLSDLLPTGDGLWAVGPGWVMSDKGLFPVTDGPSSATVTQAILTVDSSLFVHSFYATPYSHGTIQTMDDQGTTTLEDDTWHWQHAALIDVVTAATRTPGGDLWLAGYEGGRTNDRVPPLRFHRGNWIPYPLPSSADSNFIYDIFVQSESVTWFALDRWLSTNRGVWRLDDGETPTDSSDDVWTSYPITWEGEAYALALDAQERLLFGDSTGLYRQVEDGWQPIVEGRSICEIVTATDGTVFAEISTATCDEAFNRFNLVRVIRPGGAQETMSIPELVASEFDRVASVTQRNRMWTVAPDGAVWYVVGGTRPGIARSDGAEITNVDVPFGENQMLIGPLEVDEDNVLWFANSGDLWRRSLMPDFGLDEQVWLLAPGSTRHRSIAVHTAGGYEGDVTLQVTGLPPGVTATFDTNPVPAGQSTHLMLSATSAVTPGTYNGVLSAADDTLMHTADITLIVAPTVYDVYGPLALKNP